MYEVETHFGKLLLKQSATVLTHLTWWPLTQWPQIKPLLPGTDVWTKFEEGRSRRSRVIDRNWFCTFDPVTLTFDPVISK